MQHNAKRGENKPTHRTFHQGLKFLMLKHQNVNSADYFFTVLVSILVQGELRLRPWFSGGFVESGIPGFPWLRTWALVQAGSRRGHGVVIMGRIWGCPARHGGRLKNGGFLWTGKFMKIPNLKWMMTGGSPISSISGWWFGCHQFYFPINMGFRLSSQLTNSYFSRGVALAHQPDSVLRGELWYDAEEWSTPSRFDPEVREISFFPNVRDAMNRRLPQKRQQKSNQSTGDWIWISV